jgi:hypothetical protein
MANLSINVKGALAFFLVVSALIATYYDSHQVCCIATVVWCIFIGYLAAAAVLFSTLLVTVHPVKYHTASSLCVNEHFLIPLLSLPYNSRIALL